MAEAYPNLQANQNFMDLQRQLAQAETDLVNARKFYNANVKQFNTKLQTVPTNLIARKFGFEKQPMFEVTAEEERQNVKVRF